MTTQFKYRVLTDSDGCKELDLEFDGFSPSLAYATGSESESFWEFDLCDKDGFEAHFQITYTLSHDLLETYFWRCINAYPR